MTRQGRGEEKAYKEESHSPSSNQSKHPRGHFPKPGTDSEDSSVEEKNGNFDGCHGEDVEELICECDLLFISDNPLYL